MFENNKHNNFYTQRACLWQSIKHFDISIIYRMTIGFIKQMGNIILIINRNGFIANSFEIFCVTYTKVYVVQHNRWTPFDQFTKRHLFWFAHSLWFTMENVGNRFIFSITTGAWLWREESICLTYSNNYRFMVNAAFIFLFTQWTCAIILFFYSTFLSILLNSYDLANDRNNKLLCRVERPCKWRKLPNSVLMISGWPCEFCNDLH